MHYMFVVMKSAMLCFERKEVFFFETSSSFRRRETVYYPKYGVSGIRILFLPVYPPPSLVFERISKISYGLTPRLKPCHPRT